MPLRRAVFREPITDLDIATVRFPMADGDKLVWGEVSDLALRERAMRDGVRTGLEKKALFERYRNFLEGLASEAYDTGHGEDKDGTVVVRVTNGML
jgi:hypothetical protein